MSVTQCSPLVPMPLAPVPHSVPDPVPPPALHAGRDPRAMAQCVMDLDGVVVATVFRHTEPAAHPANDRPLTVVQVTGDVDQDTVALIGAALIDAIDASPSVCCDLGSVDFFGADGINTMLAAHRHAASAGHRFTVRRAHGLTRRVLEITGADQVLVLA